MGRGSLSPPGSSGGGGIRQTGGIVDVDAALDLFFRRRFFSMVVTIYVPPRRW
jgi:hypothetical protein